MCRSGVIIAMCLLLAVDGCVVYTDLSTDVALFEGSGDYQFDIYRFMRNSNKSAHTFVLVKFWAPSYKFVESSNYGINEILS